MENSEANRQKWRNLLFTTPGINQYVSGAILFEETLFQNDPDGKPFVDVMKVRPPAHLPHISRAPPSRHTRINPGAGLPPAPLNPRDLCR